MKESTLWIGGSVVVVALVVGAVIYRSRHVPEVPPESPPVAAVKPAVPEEPPVKHPLPETPAEQAMPALDDSDASMMSALTGLVGKSSVDKVINSKDLVRHIVVTVDNLPEQKVAERLRPLNPTPGSFAVSGSEDALVLDPANYERYKATVQLFRSADTKQLIAAYTRYYPLFQSAYADLGHPPQYFNDRLVEVIDHLLATPDVHDPVALAQPNVMYEFADPKLEALSAGQKVLIRMGSANSAVVKAKLRELRGELVTKSPGN